MALGPERMKHSSRRHWVAESGQGPEPLPTLQRGGSRSLLLLPKHGDASLEDSQGVLWLSVQPPTPEPQGETWVLDTTNQRLREAAVAGDEAPGPEAVTESPLGLPGF